MAGSELGCYQEDGSKEEIVEVGEAATNYIKPGVEDEFDSEVVSVNGTGQDRNLSSVHKVKVRLLL